MSPEEMQRVRRTALVVLGLIALRMIAAAFTPLMLDEAYYWKLSKNLAGGYYDHPPMVAAMIRLGTMLAGDTEFGVRLIPILLVLPMSWAVYRTAVILFDSPKVGSSAVILLNATMPVSLGTIIATPDTPLILASSFVLLSLAKVLKTGRGVWWLAVGVSVGLALMSKYTGLLFGPIILIWLVAAPGQRHWLTSPWPYLGGLVALAIFSPNLLWNADHQWVSFIKQLGRAWTGRFSPRTFATLLPDQLAYATPAVFLLGASGYYALLKGYVGTRTVSILINAMALTIVFYFAVHSLHANVHPQWLGPMYPALAIAAAVAAHLVEWGARWQRAVNWLLRWSIPVSLLMSSIVIVQTNTGLLNGYHRDETAREVAVGGREVAAELVAIQARVGAGCVLVSHYGTTAWLEFYMPKGSCVVQYSERYRWVNMPEPDPALLKGKLLFVHDVNLGPPRLETRFLTVEKLGEVTRKRGPLVIQTFGIFLLEGARGDVLDRSPPPELGRSKPWS